MRIHPLKRPPALPILLVALLAASSFVSTVYAQDTPDLAAAREIVAMQDAQECLALIDSFLKNYPDSRYIADILQTGVARAIELDGSSRLALDYAERFIQSAEASGDAATLANSLNSMAWTLYEGGAHLARAEEWVARALEVLPESRRTMSLKASTLDTQAHIAGALGKYEQAIASQKAAVEIDPRNAAYKGTLGTFYMEAGMAEEAESYLVEAILNAPADETVRSAFEMLVKARGASDPTEYKTRLLGEAAHEALMASDDSKALSMNLARAFVELGVLPERAFAYAELAVATSPAEEGAGDYLQARMTMAAWQFAYGDVDHALELMSDLTRIASPYDTEFHLLYGGALQKAGRDRDAIEAYMLPLAAYPTNTALREALEPLWTEVYGPEASLDEALEQRALGLENWHPTEHFEAPDSWEGRVALAELFTGSECPPCVASDLAFDGLLEYYPTEVLAVLEYHEHIPRPDPMTNPDTEARMAYYTRNVVGGVPTAIFNGTNSSVGGGGASAAGSRFNLYNWSVEKGLEGSPAISIELDASLQGEEVSFSSSVGVVTADRSADLRLRVALAEERVHHPGGNGIEEHKMVVRSFIGGPDGYVVGARGGTFEGSVSLTQLETDLRSYLDEWETENASGFRGGGGFPARPVEMDRSRLVVVAFVQDDNSKRILQAKLVPLR